MPTIAAALPDVPLNGAVREESGPRPRAEGAENLLEKYAALLTWQQKAAQTVRPPADADTYAAMPPNAQSALTVRYEFRGRAKPRPFVLDDEE